MVSCMVLVAGDMHARWPGPCGMTGRGSDASGNVWDCYDSICLRLGPVPELHPAWSDPWVFQPRHIVRCDASCDPVPPHMSACLCAHP